MQQNQIHRPLLRSTPALASIPAPLTQLSAAWNRGYPAPALAQPLPIMCTSEVCVRVDLADLRMAAQVKASRSRHRDALQGIILTAVYLKHNDPIHKAVEVIRDQRLDGRKPSKEGQKGGLQLLDFLPQKDAQVSLSRCNCRLPLIQIIR